MRIFIVAINERLPGWARDAVDEFARRLPREWRFEIIEVRPEKRQGQPVERIKAAEAQRLLERTGHARLVALDEHGEQITTRQLAEAITAWQGDGRDVALLIGGADGLDASLLTQADRTLALSKLTLPHALARVVLVEQLYRAASLLAGHPYHRD
jgi:23S rRNA (pseudouridine1915-N3)-methyltransferase